MQFINAHCHLELTNLAGKLPRNKPFFEWLAELRKQVETWTKEDYQASYTKGLEFCKAAGTAVVYDVGNQLSEPEFTEFAEFSELKLFSMHEIIKEPLPFPCTPHSIYATPPELVKRAVKQCREAGIPWSIHLAEFDESDRFSDFLKIFDGELELVKKGFIIHGNFLTESDLAFMAKNDIALVHCPQSHEWFGHRDPDFEMWKRSGVDICIATDSLASASSLDLMEQVKTLLRRYPKAFTQEEALAAITSTPGKYLFQLIPTNSN
ncbi:MAG: amidohydrolase family protein [Fibromonadaceae bacterium]|jgi:cytosine/adenosine deaminase-related metal-dependent hydrolase|nr:amidohydrolase family protein [Fibromonadaceae bacterium]